MNLDRSKPFSEAWGSVPYRYLQDGRFFNGAGEEVAEDGRPIAEAKQTARNQKQQAFEQAQTAGDARPVHGNSKKPARNQKQQAAAPEVDDQLAAQMEA